MNPKTPAGTVVPALDRARRKAYWRLLPLLFICYVIGESAVVVIHASRGPGR